MAVLMLCPRVPLLCLIVAMRSLGPKGYNIHLLHPLRQPECKPNIYFSCGLHRQIPGYIALYIEGSWFHVLVGSPAGMDISQYEFGKLGPWHLKDLGPWGCRSEVDSPQSNQSISHFALEFSTDLVDCILFTIRNTGVDTSIPM